MMLEVMRGEQKGILFCIRESGGRTRWLVRRKKTVRETWEITSPLDEAALAELSYAQKFIVPGCRIQMSDGTKLRLTQQILHGGGYSLEGCSLSAEIGDQHPFILKKGDRTAAWVSLVHPGEKKAYDMWVEGDHTLLCVSILAGYILCRRVG